ncbi:hypothetical protein BJF79_20795 [Actinomadura sp. CNU-125]|uniref:hypothetical protein n=1 Tax=Actinomadura sp. CNU-125 TaxID=1904961 RepID=UPI0009596DE8|nr:hypothetical protein [Actinomadura sp. CNU-125]OLT13313.1 hypothetical protein BJF79_20795 [Actinomadura sp. CNU-125]
MDGTTSLQNGEATAPAMFQPPAEETSSVEHLFAGGPRHIVQTPLVRNTYKKKSGSSDGARTYDTTSV